MYTGGRSFTPALIAAFAVTFGLVSSFSVAPADRTMSKTALAVSFSSHAADDLHEHQHPNRRAEFSDLEPVKQSLARQARLRMDTQNRNRFAKYGDDLWGLRESMTALSEKLVAAINGGIRETEDKIRENLREMEKQDPELVYEIEIEKMYKAKSEGRTSDAELHSKKALAARSCLPQFNLEGLWVGK
jgi:predicted acylesterase/phospholipase RssA